MFTATVMSAGLSAVPAYGACDDETKLLASDPYELLAPNATPMTADPCLTHTVNPATAKAPCKPRITSAGLSDAPYLET
jgi:hypothetical protein